MASTGGSLVSLFHATSTRLKGDDATAVVAALLDKPVDDVLVKALTIIFYIARDNPQISGTNLLDTAIASAADLEGINSETDPQLQKIADYLVQNMDTIPQPIPRSLLQYLGVALVKKGDFSGRAAAVKHLLSSYTFAV